MAAVRRGGLTIRGLSRRALSRGGRPTLEHDGLTTDGARELELDGVDVFPRQPGTGGVVDERHDADVVNAPALVAELGDGHPAASRPHVETVPQRPAGRQADGAGLVACAGAQIVDRLAVERDEDAHERRGGDVGPRASRGGVAPVDLHLHEQLTVRSVVRHFHRLTRRISETDANPSPGTDLGRRAESEPPREVRCFPGQPVLAGKHTVK
jgi:hypothetical protein